MCAPVEAFQVIQFVFAGRSGMRPHYFEPTSRLADLHRRICGRVRTSPACNITNCTRQIAAFPVDERGLVVEIVT